MTEKPEFLEAIPHNGYLPHAIRNVPTFIYRTAPFIVTTYMRALCGVGQGGMRVQLDKDGNMRPWEGVDGCKRCHVKLSKIKEQP